MSTSVFVSWSGQAAKGFARDFAKWLQLAGSPIDVFFSPQIPKGARWADVIMKELKSCDAGVLVLTSENLTSEWLHFEAGALAVAVPEDRGGPSVQVLLIDVEPWQIPDDLRQFQATTFDQEELIHLILSMKAISGDLHPTPDVVRSQVGAHWAMLDGARQKALALLQDVEEARSEPVDRTEQILREMRAELGVVRLLGEQVLRGKSLSPEVGAVRRPVRGDDSQSTLDDDLDPMATYRFATESDFDGFYQWLLQHHAGLDVSLGQAELAVTILSYDEVAQLDRLNIRRAAVETFGGERLD